MNMIKNIQNWILPWLLIVFGFFMLNMFQGYLGVFCMVLGIVMPIERRWPEKWKENDLGNKHGE